MAYREQVFGFAAMVPVLRCLGNVRAEGMIRSHFEEIGFVRESVVVLNGMISMQELIR